MHVLLNLPNC